MNQRPFAVKIDGTKTAVTIKNPGELDKYIKQNESTKPIATLLQVALRDPVGQICWLAPVNYDSRFRLWDSSFFPIFELWKLLQNFLHIRVAEEGEQVHIPPSNDLGRTDSNGSSCAF